MNTLAQEPVYSTEDGIPTYLDIQAEVGITKHMGATKPQMSCIASATLTTIETRYWPAISSRSKLSGSRRSTCCSSLSWEPAGCSSRVAPQTPTIGG